MFIFTVLMIFLLSCVYKYVSDFIYYFRTVGCKERERKQQPKLIFSFTEKLMSVVVCDRNACLPEFL